MTPREHHLLLVGVLVYALALLVLSRLVLSELAIEADGYAERGAELMAGHLVGATYHPFLYPELIALVGAIVGNAETAARAVSSVLAGLFVYVSYRFGRCLFGRRPAIAAAVLLAVNGEVVQYGIRSTSDMTAAAFFMAAMWLLVSANGRRRWLGAAGVCIGLAAAARMNFLFLLPVLAMAAAFRPSGRAGFWVFGGGALVGMLPNVVPNMLVFGVPLTSDNWRNMAFKVTGDVKALTDPPYAGLFDLLRQDGRRLLDMACDDFVAVWTRHLGQAMAGNHAVSPTTLVMTLLVPLGVAWLAWVGPWRRTLLLVMVCATHAALVSLTFWPHTRLFLPVQPIAVTVATGALFALSRRTPWIAAAACAALSLGVATSVAPTLRAHRDAVPVEEIEAAMEIARRDGLLTTIASFHSSMARLVPAQFVYVPQMPFGRHEPAAYLARVADSLAQSPADYLILGPKTCGGVSTTALREVAPADAEVVHQDDAVLVLRLHRPSMDWAERAAALVAEGTLELAIDVRPDAGVLLAGFTARPPAGDAILIPLGRVGEHSYRSTMRAPADFERWSFVPSCVLTDGRKLMAPAVSVTR